MEDRAAQPPARRDGARRRLAVAAGVTVVALLVVVVVALTRPPAVTPELGAAELPPAPTTARPSDTVAPDTTPPDDTATTEAPPPAEEDAAGPAQDPGPAGPPVTIQYSLPRPSTVLQGLTVGNIPVYNAPNGAVKLTLPNPKRLPGESVSVPLILLARQQAGDWIEAILPIRPNGTTGWVRRSDFTVSTHDWRIEVRLSQFNLRVYNGDQLVMNTGIGVATAASPTPGGLFYTTELLQPPNPNGPYGPYAYGLSGYSDTYTSFGGGPGQLGLHGTNDPGAIGHRVSHGCIRLRNADITTLARTLPLGVPVLVFP